MTTDEIEIRECEKIEELDACARLQKEVFALPDLEISPRRHLIVTKSAGGFTLGAFAENELVGFVLSVPGFRGAERFFYSHMTAVSKDFQNLHVGTRLKWAQRERSLRENVKFIKWTFQPIQARNAFFNLERLGAVIKTYAPNFYGTDYSTAHNENGQIGLDSDRLFCEWHLERAKVAALSNAEKFTELKFRTIGIGLSKKIPNAPSLNNDALKKNFKIHSRKILLAEVLRATKMLRNICFTKIDF
jgi:predicted GNAT superfamily acetyltransferase